MPAGGLVLPWPLDGAPGGSVVEAGEAELDDGELRITALPARVRVGRQD